jgi:hypothetical protein
MRLRPLVAALILLSMSLGIGVATGPDAISATPIQPGASITMSTADSVGWCTLNWIYDGKGKRKGKVYAGTAAHCVAAVGQRISLATMSLGEPVLSFGKVAYIAKDLDYALIEVDRSRRGLVNPALRGHPDIPKGVSTRKTAAIGDQMQFSGHGLVFDLTEVTQQSRFGFLAYNDGTQQYVYGPVTQGDSGGPVADVTDGNKAFGIVNTLSAGLTPLPFAGEGGLALEGVLKHAAAHGFPVKVRIVR